MYYRLHSTTSSKITITNKFNTLNEMLFGIEKKHMKRNNICNR